MEQADEFLTKKYDHLARFYDWWWKTYTINTVPRALHAAALTGRECICDIGCGTGALEVLLCERFPALTIDACDVSSGMIARAKQKLKGDAHVHFAEGDFLDLPWEANRYDALFSLSNFHYFSAPEAFLQKAFEISKPGGSLIILDWTRESLRARLYQAVMQSFDKSFQRVISRQELIAMLEQAGWRVMLNETFSIRLFWSLMLIKAEKPV